MERVLKAVPVDLRVKMEALVHDLTLALEESSNNTSTVKRRWGLRRRARSTGNLPFLNTNKQSDDSSSSVCEIRVPKSTGICKYQSDSDDTNKTKRFGRFSNLHNISNIESDSVNENFIPRTVKRKRKFKRMAVDSDSNPSTSHSIHFLSNTVSKKKRTFRNNRENKYEKIYCGKRKRSCRERSIDCDMRSPKPSKSKNSKNDNNEDAMDCSRISSSSISSSDSEVDVNDEDREGDDEQSDWFGDSNWWDDGNTSEDKLFDPNTLSFEYLSPSPPLITLPTVASAATITSTTMSTTSTTLATATATATASTNRLKIQWIKGEGLNGREIRAGRRHVDNKPGYSIITSANEKVSRFLQDPSQSELKLHPMRQPERDKLRRLANLYSLNLKGDLTCPVLYKTRSTTQAICVDQVSFNPFSDYKRLRRTPPN